jgi:hypothetical protein
MTSRVEFNKSSADFFSHLTVLGDSPAARSVRYPSKSSFVNGSVRSNKL